MSQTSRKHGAIGRIKVSKSYDALADALRERILDGEFVEGTSLPSERDIVDETGLSRGSVREALRILEAQGLIRTRPGRYGGVVATLPDEKGIGRLVSLFVRGRKVPLSALVEARHAIEPNLAYLAAQNRTGEDIEILKRECDRLEQAIHMENDVFGPINYAWHSAVAKASHSEMLIAFLSSISTSFSRSGAAHSKVFNPATTAEMHAEVVRAHRSVTDAIVKGQADAAKRRMERHIDAYAARIAPATATEIDLG